MGDWLPRLLRSASATRVRNEHLAEVHVFERLGRRILFHVASQLFYEITPLVAELIQALEAPGATDPLRALTHRYRRRDLDAGLALLRERRILSPAAERVPRVTGRSSRLRHLELMVTHGCNMRCRYCYGAEEHASGHASAHLYGSDTCGMPIETARAGVAHLLDASGAARDVDVVFFGGEPLLAFELIRALVPEARELARSRGKRIGFSLSTNGALLDDEIVAFLVRNRVGCQISIDGPAAIQDANRRFAGGAPTYDAVLPGVRRLIAARPGRVPARVTVASGLVEIPAIVDHLLGLGFGSVHVEPAIGASPASVGADDVIAIERQTERLAGLLVERVRRNRPLPFTNLVRFVRSTRVVEERLAHHCGAGRSYLALAQDGAFFPCHRFVGIPEYRMGDVWHGFDAQLAKRMRSLTVDERPGCSDCWARYQCGGGCWKHAVDASGSLEQPDAERSCRLIRHQIECAMSINATLGIPDDAFARAGAVAGG